MKNEPFIPYPKTKRYSGFNITITEKIDGTNAQIHIDEDWIVTTSSRNRIITPNKDNYGFATWVRENLDDVKKLGKGRHYGEWWGEGIQKNRYGVTGKHFSLFNTFRPTESLPECIKQVPVLYTGPYLDSDIMYQFNTLKEQGSKLGGSDPEGIIIYFHEARNVMKMTYDYTGGKWGKK